MYVHTLGTCRLVEVRRTLLCRECSVGMNRRGFRLVQPVTARQGMCLLLRMIRMNIYGQFGNIVTEFILVVHLHLESRFAFQPSLAQRSHSS